MRPRRFLLVTTALSSATLVAACRKETVTEPPPGNPKGAIYDAGPIAPLPGNPKGSTYDGLPPPTVDAGPSESDGGHGPGTKEKLDPKPTDKPDAGPVIRRLPANPKGSHYDRGKPPAPTKPTE